MSSEKKSFVAYNDWGRIFAKLSNENAGKMVKHLFAYTNGDAPVITEEDGLLEVVFEQIQMTLDRDSEKYMQVKKKRVEAGKIGGTKSGEARATKPNQTEANEALASNAKQTEANEAVSDSVSGSVNENVNENNKTKRTLRGAADSLSIKMPFDSDTFKAEWERWKAYKKTQFRFNFKSSDSEQMALNDLEKISGGVEKTANAIILRSITKGWTGLFELKEEAKKPVSSTGTSVTEENATYAVMQPMPYGTPERWDMAEWHRLKGRTQYQFLRFES